jgi:L-aminopeptidase/D-esterase-like protein
MTECRNLLTDVSGLRVGNAEDERVATGVTVLIADRPLCAAVDVRGGGPGTRETDALGLTGSVDEVHALVLSGGSAFGLAAATGVQAWLAERGIGFDVRGARVPIVPQAVLFDLLNGGDKAWGPSPPYEALARRACETAAVDFSIGSRGAGFGATTANLRGGLGSASEALEGGLVVGALVAVNAAGSVTLSDTRHFWAAPLERGKEFGGAGFPTPLPAGALAPRLKGGPGQATTIAVVATNARLSKREAHRLAVMANAGLARAVYPVHTPLDGDLVFAAATGEIEPEAGWAQLAVLGTVAANVLGRAVARAVYEAAPASASWRGPPAYRTRFAVVD